MTLRLCVECGEPCEGSRCDLHAPEPAMKESATVRGYDHRWRRLSERARKLQPWCSDCGTTDDLTGDHLRWPARTLRDVDVVCRGCNAKRGETPRDGRWHPRGKTLAPIAGNPPRESFRPTHSAVAS